MTVPDVAGQDAAGLVNRVLGLALVELEIAGAVVGLDHARVLVLGVDLVDHPAVVRLGLERADRQRDQRRYRRRRQRPAAHRPQAGHRRDRDRQREDEEGPPRAHQRDQHKRGEQGADQAARGRQRVEAAGHAARLFDVRDGQPDRPGRHRAEQQHRHGHQHQNGQQGPDERAGRDLVERLDRHVEQRVRGERHQREQPGRQQAEQAEPAHVRVAVREAPAQPVADRERHQHDPDGVGPHDRGGAEVRSEQPDRGDLGAQRSRSDHEDEQRQGRHSDRKAS